jgi:UDP-glucose 6-dehydrogenase
MSVCSCFGKDTAALAAIGQEYGTPLHLVKAGRIMNCMQRERAVETLQRTEILRFEAPYSLTEEFY